MMTMIRTCAVRDELRGEHAGRYPLGNTGGADVRATVPMAIPEDLAPLLGHVPVARRAAASER